MNASPRAVLWVLLAAGLTYAFSQTMVLPAIPALAAHLNTDATGAFWVLTAFLVAASIAAPVVGKLGDLYGRGRMLGAVSLVFCVGSALCALSSGLAPALVGRVLQGVAAGVFPLAYGVVRDVFPAPRVMTTIGTLSISLGLGSGLGPPLAGLVVDHLGPAAIFWIGMVGAIPAMAAPWVIRDVPARQGPRLDWLGAIVLSCALTSLLLAVTQGNRWDWASPRVLALFGASIALALLWLRIERRPEPLIDIALLRERTVALTNVASLLVGAGMFGAYVPVATFTQAPVSTGYGFGLSVAAAGLVLLPHGLVLGLCGHAGGALCRTVGPRATLVAGAAANTLAAGMLLVAHGSLWWLVASVSVLGVGQALALAAMANLVVEAVPSADVGVATGMTTVMRTIGMAVGSAVVAAVLAASMAPGDTLAAESGYLLTFGLAALLFAGASAAGLAIPRAGLHPVAARPATAVPPA